MATLGNALVTLLLATTLIACASNEPRVNAQENALDEPSDLVVRSGEVRRLPARTHRFRDIQIEEGGTLALVEGSNRWLILWAEGDVNIAGRIVAQGFRAQGQTVTDRTPDNREISHSFENTALGGNGGLGGTSNYQGRSLPGGRGASGTPDWGGGGGSGGGLYMMGPASRLTEPGRDAIDWQAAPASAYGTASTGSGARADTRRNGAPVMIYAGGKMSLAGAVIDLRGRNGAAGSPSPANCPPFPGGNRGGTGGGGGAPGGDGGQLILVADSFIGLDSAQTLVDGGTGGPGGSIGCTHGGATAGTTAQSGASGFVDRMSRRDWESQPTAD